MANTRMSAWMDTAWDVGLTLFQLLHAILAGFLVDAAGNGETLKKAVAIYLPVVHGAIVGFLLWQTYMKVGEKAAAKKNPETLIGIWAEVLNVTLFFGVLYNCARVWSRPSTDPIHANPFLDELFISIYDSSTVQAGIGFVSTSPSTAFEYITTWLSAFVGGILFINLFLINVIFSRRFWASIPEEKEALIPSAPAPVKAAMENWKLTSVVAARA